MVAVFGFGQGEAGSAETMPLYEYECNDCGHRFERIRKFSDPPLSTCPVCGGAVRKLLSPPAIQFKGSGWYVTDYARKPGGKKDGDEARGGGKKDGGKKDGAGGGGGKKDGASPSKDASSAASKTESTAASKSASDSSAARRESAP